jgi:hypothetical protein
MEQNESPRLKERQDRMKILNNHRIKTRGVFEESNSEILKGSKLESDVVI